MLKPKGKKHLIPASPPPSAIGRFHTLVVSDNLWVSWLFSAVEKIDVGALPETSVAEQLSFGTIYTPNLTTYSTGLAYNAGSIFIGGGTGVTEISEADGTLLNKFEQTNQMYAGCLLVADSAIFAPIPFYGGVRKYDFDGNLLADSLANPLPRLGDPINSMVSDGTSIWSTYSAGNRVSKTPFNLTTSEGFQTAYAKPIGITYDGTYIWVSFQGSSTQPPLPNGGILAKYATDFTELASYVLSDCLGYIEYFPSISMLGVNDWANNAFLVVDPTDGTVLQTTPVGDWGGRPSIDSRNYMFVASYASNTVTRIPFNPVVPQAYDLLFHFDEYPFINSGTLPTSQTAPATRLTTSSPIYGSGSLISNRGVGNPDSSALIISTTTTVTISSAWTLRLKFILNHPTNYISLLKPWTGSGIESVSVNDNNNLIVMQFGGLISCNIILGQLQELSVELFNGTLYCYIDGVLVGNQVYNDPLSGLPITGATLISGTTIFVIGDTGNAIADGEQTIIDEFIFVNGTALAAGGNSYAVQTAPYSP